MKKGLLSIWRRGVWLIAAIVLCFTATAQAETDVTAKIQLVKSVLGYDRLAKQSYLTVSVKNISADVLLCPIKVVITSVTPSTVTVANADGVTADGKPYFIYTTENGFFPPGETIGGKIWRFSNPKAVRFSYATRVVGSVPEGATSAGPVGGTLTVADPASALLGLSVTIPPNALTQNEYITVVEVKENLPQTEAFSNVIAAMDFSSNSNSFNENIQITLPYPDADNNGYVDGTGIHESNIQVVT